MAAFDPTDKKDHPIETDGKKKCDGVTVFLLPRWMMDRPSSIVVSFFLELKQRNGTYAVYRVLVAPLSI
jgi:hypothetical protein